MKLSDLRPCDNCDQPVRSQFYVVRTSLAIVDPTAGREVVGMTQFFGGHLALAEAMVPEPDCIKIAGDHDRSLWSEYLICHDCFWKELSFSNLQEKLNNARRAMECSCSVEKLESESTSRTTS